MDVLELMDGWMDGGINGWVDGLWMGDECCLLASAAMGWMIDDRWVNG